MRTAVDSLLDTTLNFVITGFFVSLLAGGWNPYEWPVWFKFLWFAWFFLNAVLAQDKRDKEKTYAQTTKQA